jgi:hypothetical protein
MFNHSIQVADRSYRDNSHQGNPQTMDKDNRVRHRGNSSLHCNTSDERMKVYKDEEVEGNVCKMASLLKMGTLREERDY